MNHFIASEHTPELNGTLTGYDFDGPVTIVFDDYSNVNFQHAFARREGEKGKYLVVYTEHCGYHVFDFIMVEYYGNTKLKYGNEDTWDPSKDEAEPPEPRKRWIPLCDYSPWYDGTYIVWRPGDKERQADWSNKGWKDIKTDDPLGQFTHWCPMPERQS